MLSVDISVNSINSVVCGPPADMLIIALAPRIVLSPGEYPSISSSVLPSGRNARISPFSSVTSEVTIVGTRSRFLNFTSNPGIGDNSWSTIETLTTPSGSNPISLINEVCSSGT